MRFDGIAREFAHHKTRRREGTNLPQPDSLDRLAAKAHGLTGEGDVLVAAGNREAALVACGKGFAIHELLAAADPGNAGLQRDLADYREKISDIKKIIREFNQYDSQRIKL